jgi:hypothetical protein
MPVCTKFVAMIVCGAATSSLLGEIVDEFDLGTGANTSTILFQFTNENQYLYTIRYDDDMTGRTAFDLISDAQPGYFVADISESSFGDFLVGLGIGDDFDSGSGTAPEYLDYWHYWTKEVETEAWLFSQVGFSDRDLSDGSVDGWVFNSNDAPIPAPAVLPAALGLGLIRRRRG